ncbi:MAG: hypothetical protein ACTSU5_22305, partial [Promethearchaeota archaeon]
MTRRSTLGTLFVLTVMFSFACSLPFPATANTRSTTSPYGSDTVYSTDRVHDATLGNYKNWKMTVSFPANKCIVGVKFKYVTPDSKSTNSHIQIKVDGDQYSATYDFTDISPSSTPAWYTAKFDMLGGYIVDDDPEIEFIGKESQVDCLNLTFTNASDGHTYVNTGAGWQLKGDVDIIAEVIYEDIPDLVPNAAVSTGDISEGDNFEAYQAYLYAGRKYQFNLTSVETNIYFVFSLYELHTDYLDSTKAIVEDSSSVKHKSFNYTVPEGRTGMYFIGIESKTAPDIGGYELTLASFEPGIPTITAYDSSSSDGHVFLNWTQVQGAD